jgi:WD40 repeat protein
MLVSEYSLVISALRFSSDGKLLATGGFDDDTVRNPVKVILFNAATGAALRTLDAPHTVRSLEFSADSAWFAASYGVKRISLWSTTT